LTLEKDKTQEENNAKCFSSKKIYLEGDFAAGVYLSKAQNLIPPPPTHCIRVYSILINKGKGGRVREGHKGGSKIPTLLTVSPVNKL
jgi:hypothetical protein